MTDLTGRGGRNMVDALADNRRAVMTAFTGAIHLGVIDQRIDRGPGRTRMTGLTQVARVDVIDALADGDDVVMTGGTARRRGAVIKHRHQPVIGAMTGLAHGGGRNVVDALADDRRAVMTAFTRAIHLVVIDQRIHWRPARTRMTGITIV